MSTPTAGPRIAGAKAVRDVHFDPGASTVTTCQMVLPGDCLPRGGIQTLGVLQGPRAARFEGGSGRGAAQMTSKVMQVAVIAGGAVAMMAVGASAAAAGEIPGTGSTWR